MLARTGTVLLLVVETPWSALSRHEDEVAISGIWSFNGGAENKFREHWHFLWPLNKWVLVAGEISQPLL